MLSKLNLFNLSYQDALAILHTALKPNRYVEIGCRYGHSLQLSNCRSLAIDPEFELTEPLHAPTQIFRETSDDFFAARSLIDTIGGPFDLAFIDGMHKSEFALRDFMHLEQNAHSGSVIAIDDVLPDKIEWTSRERQTQAWTGDVYKIIPLLRRMRPDLHISVFTIKMKGIAVISNLDPENKTLWNHYSELEAELTSPASEIKTIKALRKTLDAKPAAEFEAYAKNLAGDPPARAPATQAVNHQAYLELLKKSILNEIYLDDELRLLYLRKCLDGSEAFDYQTYHDIRDSRSAEYTALKEARAVGRFPERNIHLSGFSHSMMGRKRMDSLHECLDLIRKNKVPGDIMECGVWRGGGCIFAAGYLSAHGMTDRKVFVADSFEGLPVPSAKPDAKLDYSKEKFPELAVSLDTVTQNFAQYGLLSDNVRFLEGWFEDTLPTAPTDQVALLRLDGDLYSSTMDCLEAVYDKVPNGGVIIVDDYGVLEPCRRAVHEFFKARKLKRPKVQKIDWTGVYWVKSDPPRKS